eukprot:6598564-Prymnesium_polylepis.1
MAAVHVQSSDHTMLRTSQFTYAHDETGQQIVRNRGHAHIRTGHPSPVFGHRRLPPVFSILSDAVNVGVQEPGRPYALTAAFPHRTSSPR